jgi:hypothetical protein
VIPLRDQVYYVGFWFLSGREGDWLACVYQDGEDGFWHLVHRCRQHTDDRVWGSDDPKSWTHQLLCASVREEDVIEVVGRLQSDLSSPYETGAYLPIRGSLPKLILILKEKCPPWLHIREQLVLE